MFSESVRNRLNGYRKRLVHEYETWEMRRKYMRRGRNYERWIDSLRQSPPEVFLGANLSYGGVRNHVRAIRNYSSLEVQLVPDEDAMGDLGEFSEEIRNRFRSFVPSGSPVVHSHVMPWMIRWCELQKKRGSTWIHTYHNQFFPEFGRNGMSPDQLEINDALVNEACHADVRLSVSRWQQKYLRDTHGIETGYLANGVDVRLCDRARADRFRKLSGIGEEFILWVGRNSPVKNPADFVSLARRIPRQTCVMIGHDLSPESLARDWEVEAPPNLHCFGEMPHGEVQDAIAASSALVVTSRREGLPTLVLEGMAQSTPVVVPDDPGCLEAAGHGDLGFVYRQGDIADLAAQAGRALQDDSRIRAARERIETEYDWRVVAAKLDEIYRKGNVRP